MKEQHNKTLAKLQIFVFGHSTRFWLVSSKQRMI